MGYNQN
jgi:RNA recognition motif. (a.k.a. RRM, RBD, or RNP domain)